MEELSKLLEQLGPYGFTLVIVVYLYLSDKGLLPWAQKKNGYTSIMNNHLPHLKNEVDGLTKVVSTLAPYIFVEQKFREAKEEQNRSFDKLEQHISEKFELVNKRIDSLENK